MSIPSCCKDNSKGSRRQPIEARNRGGSRQQRGLARRSGELAGWAVPGTILVLLPKCPACVAAYVAIGTGIGISIPTAVYLRTSLVIVSAASLIYLTTRRVRRGLARSRASPKCGSGLQPVRAIWR